MLTNEQIASIVEHMNADHADAVLLYARVLGRVKAARSARLDTLH